MRTSLFRFAVLVGSLVACSPGNPPQPVEAPVQPLVIGHSPSAPIAVGPDEPTLLATPDDGSAAAAPKTTFPVPARDPRRARLPRARALIVTELQQLEALFAATQKSAPDRPRLVRRLADDYAELSRATDGSLAAGAHKKALTDYELIIAEYPQDPSIDEVYYYAGLEHELAGDAAGARRSYYQLIMHAPKSPLVPLAYFAFGELFFREAIADPTKNDLANQAFIEVLKYPAPGNKVFADALLRTGQIADRKNETQRAAMVYTKVQRDFPASEAAAEAQRLLAAIGLAGR